jgi:glyoxylase-like metal-dependent hydrolase (beta-lactamase superfamily II)
VRVHHLNCGTLCPYGSRLITGEGGFGSATMVCHCLLVEAGDSLVLVDTGFGADDMRHPYARLGFAFTAGFRVQADAASTAFERIRALGLNPADVRDIVCTHLDLDHAGGLPDFPDARVHVFEAERDAAVNPSLRDRLRYPPAHVAHGPDWVVHAVDGDTWHGFDAVRVLPDVEAEIALIPLPGHSRGHIGVAVRDSDGWLLHCGDAYFHHGEMAEPPDCPVGLRLFQAAMAADNGARRANQDRLRELARRHPDDVTLFCGHSKFELDRALAAAAR